MRGAGETSDADVSDGAIEDADPVIDVVDSSDSGEECLRASDCEVGTSCLNNRCVADDQGTDSARVDSVGGDTADDPGDTGTCLGRENGQLGEACGCPGDCQSDLCLGVEPPGFCTTTCASYADCNPPAAPGDFLCTMAAGQRLCVGSRWGEQCAAPVDCEVGHCLRSASGNSHCTIDCTTGDECPPGAACGEVDFFYTADGGEIDVVRRRVCSPVGEICVLLDDLGLNSCLSGMCVTEEGQDTGFCSVLCNPGDVSACPTGWTCGVVPEAGVAICQR